MSKIDSGIFKGLRRNAFGLILADPPWPYQTYSGLSIPHRGKTMPYNPMPMDELLAMPVADLAAPDCALCLWTFGAHLEQTLVLGATWGFTYKTDLLVWVKTGKNDPNVRPIGMGHWSRKQAEYMLLFTRGSPKRLDAGVRQLIETNDHVIHAPKPQDHSRKPQDAYGRLERLVAGPRIELFARQQQPGWTAWGDETEKFVSPATRSLDDLFGISTSAAAIRRSPVLEDLF